MMTRLQGTLGEADSDAESSSGSSFNVFEEAQVAPAKLIDHEPLAREWLKADFHNDIHTLKEIEDLTGCRLQPNQDRKSILIRGQSNEDIARAVVKLDLILDLNVRRSVFVYLLEELVMDNS